MVKTIYIKFREIDKKILKIMFIGVRFSFFLCVISTLLLFFYRLKPISFLTYEIGLILFKMSLTFAIEFIICGFSIDTIKKQMI